MTFIGDQSFEELKTIFDQAHLTQNENPKIWLKSVCDKLYSMFRTPMKAEYQCEAFKWVANLCITVGDFSWIRFDDDWTEDNAKIFACIANLSMNEIRILLPLIQRHLTLGEVIEEEDGKLMARSANKNEYEKFGEHLIILESTIKSLVENQEVQSEEGTKAIADCFGDGELRCLLQGLKGTMNEICDYLEVAHTNWQSLVNQVDSEKFSAVEGALRIMSVWLSEDASSYEPQCKKFLIDLLVKNLLLADRPMQKDLLILAIHSVCTQDQEIMTVLRTISNHREALQRYLDHIEDQTRTRNPSLNRNLKRDEKILKLRCGLVKDLLSSEVE